MVSARAGDRFEEAVDAAQEAANRLGLERRERAVLHCSNNVVVRIGATVLKVGTDLKRIRTEVTLAGDVARAGGPVLAPLADAIEVGRFGVSVWPFVVADSRPAGEYACLTALGVLHRALAATTVPLPTLADRFDEVRAILDDDAASSALAGEGRSLLRAAVDAAAECVEQASLGFIHTEPHDRNRLTVGGVVVFLDLEAACVGPVEWDLAYFGDAAVQRLWPDHDRQLRRRLQIGVSACVSAYCWRHVTARPADNEMRWHAEHHLGVVRGSTQ